jgi:hypothetical protein
MKCPVCSKELDKVIEKTGHTQYSHSDKKCSVIITIPKNN